MILYDYCRSSAAYRVRISLNLKQVDYQQHSIDILHGEQSAAQHQQRNAQKLVPVLEDKGVLLSQSLAICEYLDEAYPASLALVSGDFFQRARIRAFAQAIACETHPLNNLRVLKYLVSELAANQQQKSDWYHHWINSTFAALEEQLRTRTTESVFCFTDQPSLAEVCLIPQIFNAKRFYVDMSAYPLLSDIDQKCQKISAFVEAHPTRQADS